MDPRCRPTRDSCGRRVPLLVEAGRRKEGGGAGSGSRVLIRRHARGRAVRKPASVQDRCRGFVRPGSQEAATQDIEGWRQPKDRDNRGPDASLHRALQLRRPAGRVLDTGKCGAPSRSPRLRPAICSDNPQRTALEKSRRVSPGESRRRRRSSFALRKRQLVPLASALFPNIFVLRNRRDGSHSGLSRILACMAARTAALE
jgi:hypothetical protein